MPSRAFVAVLPISRSILLSACGTPPTAEDRCCAPIDGQCLERGRYKYAAASFKEAQTAEAALDAELKAQEAKFDKRTPRPRAGCRREDRRR